MLNFFSKIQATIIALLALTLMACTNQPVREQPIEKREAYDKPDEAKAFFLQKRLAPGMKELSSEQLILAQLDAERLPVHVSATGLLLSAVEKHKSKSLTNWTPLGPGNIGGRTRVLRFHPTTPSIMYTAGVTGGIWLSINSGGSWVPLADALASIAVSTLDIDPHSPSTIYAGTGEGVYLGVGVRGAGIFKSTDSGFTWTQLPLTAPPAVRDFLYVNDIAVSPNFSNVVYAATGTGLWLSTNGGENWVRTIDAAASNGCTKIALRTDVTPDYAIVSCGLSAPTVANTGIWVSDQANSPSGLWWHAVGPSGATRTIPNMGRIGLAIAPSNQNIMYAVTSCTPSGPNQCGTNNVFTNGLLNVMQSIDGGATWHPQYTNNFDVSANRNLLLSNTQYARVTACGWMGAGGVDTLNNLGNYAMSIAVDPMDPSKVWVGGVDLWRSDDSGVNWGVASYWFDGSSAQYVHADQHHLVFHPGYNGTTNAILYATNDGGIFTTANARAAVGTNSSSNTSNSLCSFSSFSNRPAINWSQRNHLYAVTQFYHGTIYPDGSRFFGGTQDNGTVRGAETSPSNWTEILGGDGGYTAIDWTSSGGSTVLYAEYTGISIRKSINDGNTFVCATNGIVGCTSPFTANDCGMFINPFIMDPNNPNRLYTSGTRLWRTDNAAGVWTPASAVLNGAACSGTDSGERLSAYAVAPTNSSLLVAGTNTGRVCRLTNAMASNSSTAWEDCSSPAGGGFISSISFDRYNENKVYATISSYDLGHIWKSIDAGATWTRIDGHGGENPLPNIPTHTVAVSAIYDGMLFVGTDIGVFVSADDGANWARENTGFANVITEHLVFHSASPLAIPTELFAFTHGRGVFKTQVQSNIIFDDSFE